MLSAAAVLANADLELLSDDQRDEVSALEYTLNDGELASVEILGRSSALVTVVLPVPDWPDHDDAPHLKLEMRWSSGYPDTEPPTLLCTASHSMPVSVVAAVDLALRQHLEALTGGPALLCVVEQARDQLQQRVHEVKEAVEAAKATLWDSRTANSGKDQANAVGAASEESEEADDSDDESESGDSEEDAKKEERKKLKAMTKSQKRRMWKNMDGAGNKGRGWNWVDVISHLSKSGNTTS